MRILAYTSPARGHLYPLVPILDELAGRGHEIAVRTLSSQVSLIAARGFDAAPIAAAIEAIEHDDYRGRTPTARLRRGLATFAARAPEEVRDLRAAIAACRPDALLVDCATWGANAAAEAWGGPWAQWFPYPLPLSSRDTPPFGPGLKPARGPLGRLRDRAVRPLAIRTLERASLPAFNAVRARVGVPPYATADDMFTTPPLLLYMTAEPFEYARSDWPDSVRLVGPCPWDPPAEAPGWLEQVDRPIVLVSTSSEFQDDGRLVSAALEGLADEDVQVVATLPSASPPTAIPANARVESFVPHARILERAACAVTHGGAGRDPEGARGRRPGLRRPVRARSAGGRAPSRGRRGRHAPAGRAPEPREAAPAGPNRAGAAGRARRVAAGYEAAGGAPAAADAFEALVTQG